MPKQTYHHRNASTQRGCNGNRNKFAIGKLLDDGLGQLINRRVGCFGPERRHMLLAGVLGTSILDRFHELMRGFKTIERFKRDCRTSFLMIEHNSVKTSAMNFCMTSIAAWSCSVLTTKFPERYRDSKDWQQL
jgi:hypothetical protein